MLGKGLWLKTIALFPFFPWLVKYQKNHVYNMLVDHLEICDLFSDFHNGFRSSQSTADLLTVEFDRIASDFNRSESTQALALDLYKTFNKD